jgi:hypothetical protein
MRYELRPQKHSPLYPYDGGWAVWDGAARIQVGWYEDKARAAARVEERNEQDTDEEGGADAASL